MLKIHRQPNDSVPDRTPGSLMHLKQALVMFLVGALSGMLAGCHSAKLPDKTSPAYREIVSAFYVGLAALQVGDDVHAESKLSEVTQSRARRACRLGQLGSAGVAPTKLRPSFAETRTGARSCSAKRPHLRPAGNS